MKTKLFISCLLVIVVAFVYSFTSCNETIPVDDSANVESVLTRTTPSSPVDEVHLNMLHSMGVSNESIVDPDIIDNVDFRWSNFWNKFLFVVGMDALGAAIGAAASWINGGCADMGASILVGSVTLSIGAMLYSESSTPPNHNQYGAFDCAKAICIFDSIRQSQDYVPLNNYGYSFINVPEVVKRDAENMGKNHNETVGLIRSGVLESHHQIVMPDKYSSLVQDPFFDNVCASVLLYSGPQQISNSTLPALYKNVFSKYKEGLINCTDRSRVEILINDYALSIEANPYLSDSQKLPIYHMLIVGAYSYDYWYDVFYEKYLNSLE